MQRDNEGERNAQGRDKQEIRGEFFVKDDISGTVKAILMVRRTNRRGKDGHFLTQNAHYIIRNRPMFFHKNTRLELDITPPRPLSLPPSIVTLSAGPCCGPSLGQSLSIYERGKSKQTAATSISEEAVVFVVSVSGEESAGGGDLMRVKPPTPSTPPILPNCPSPLQTATHLHSRTLTLFLKLRGRCSGIFFN